MNLIEERKWPDHRDSQEVQNTINKEIADLLAGETIEEFRESIARASKANPTAFDMDVFS